MTVPARDRLLEFVRAAVRDGTLVKLTLGKYRGGDGSLRNVFIRPVTLKSGPQLAFVWRHATRDVTKNFAPEAGLLEMEHLLGTTFFDAHVFTTTQQAQFESQPDGAGRLKIKATELPPKAVAPAAEHDRPKQRLIPPDAPWLQALGVTNERGQPRQGMADKFRQIEKFAELLSHLVAEAFVGNGQKPDRAALMQQRPPTQGVSQPGNGGHGPQLQVADMGSGKGYLTFAVADLLRDRARVHGIEVRPALVALCNRIARETGLGESLEFSAGTITDATIDRLDVLIALHACDTATDDALARGITAGARLLVVSPCCQKEVRPQLKAPPVLGDALRHGIFQERQAEFVTDALRAQLLEWAGYRTKVFEFISTEHTAKNLMIAAIRSATPPANREELAHRIQDFAAFYGVRTQRLAQHLGFALGPLRDFVPQAEASDFIQKP